jgi:hypothetical protein
VLLSVERPGEVIDPAGLAEDEMADEGVLSRSGEAMTDELHRTVSTSPHRT